ncbi:GH-E family nuclease [Microbacterium sp.]
MSGDAAKAASPLFCAYCDRYNDPRNYQPELPHNNRGHRYE